MALTSRLVPWRQALRIIQPDTLLRWHREGFRLFWKHRSQPKPAPPKIAPETIALIQQMARENRVWGAERIQGELLKLGIHVAKGTIQRYMRGVRSPRDPIRLGRPFSRIMRPKCGRVISCPSSISGFGPSLSSSSWISVRSGSCIWGSPGTRPNGLGPKYIIRDNDHKFGSRFDWVAQASGIEVLKTPYRAPRANAICERFLGSVR